MRTKPTIHSRGKEILEVTGLVYEGDSNNVHFLECRTEDYFYMQIKPESCEKREEVERIINKINKEAKP